MEKLTREKFENGIEVLSRTITTLVWVRSALALGRRPESNLLDAGMARSHSAEVLCFDLKHTERKGGGT